MDSLINYELLLKKAKDIADDNYINTVSRFFKTGKGQYSYGIQFLGIRTNELRKLAKKYQLCPMKELILLMSSKYHELKVLALFILIEQFNKADDSLRLKIYNIYLDILSKYINNWDLVDISVYKIMGVHLLNKDKSILYTLAKSDNMWERRSSIIATFHFIKNHMFDDSLAIASILLKDKEDLIHKAVGWMLREIGKKDITVEEAFLKKHYNDIHRTTLRYAIERFENNKRQYYLNTLKEQNKRLTKTIT